MKENGDKTPTSKIPEPDIYYPIAMLASRFIAYGIAFIYIAKAAAELQPHGY